MSEFVRLGNGSWINKQRIVSCEIKKTWQDDQSEEHLVIVKLDIFNPRTGELFYEMIECEDDVDAEMEILRIVGE